MLDEGLYFLNDLTMKAMVRDAVKGELMGMGYELQSSNPDLIINFRVFDEPVTLKGYDGYGTSYWGDERYREAEDTTSYNVDAGTLLISMADRENGKVVWQGFASGLIENNSFVAGDYSERSGYESAQHLMALQPRPTALFCMSDAMATGALLALHDANLSVPHDVSVVGYDGLPASAYTLPPLTTLRQPICDLGSLAARRLLDLVEGQCRGQVREKLAPELVIRRSCAPPPEPCG